MSKQLTPTSVTREERTFRVERETPAAGDYRLRIHREVITRDPGGNVIATDQRMFAYDEPVTDTLKRPAAARYLTAINAAKSLQDAMAAESQLYDDLVDEVDAEHKAADNAEKAKAKP